MWEVLGKARRNHAPCGATANYNEVIAVNIGSWKVSGRHPGRAELCSCFNRLTTLSHTMLEKREKRRSLIKGLLKTLFGTRNVWRDWTEEI